MLLLLPPVLAAVNKQIEALAEYVDLFNTNTTVISFIITCHSFGLSIAISSLSSSNRSKLLCDAAR
jgi:hypothetical protein